MRSRINEPSKTAIHLLPPHEMLSSQLRSVFSGSRIHTSFAWLGYGTIMPRTMASDFISLLRRLNVTEDTMRMADNYFTILMNAIPETWFDQSVELGGGQPFTVGIEGDERNNRHVVSCLIGPAEVEVTNSCREGPRECSTHFCWVGNWTLYKFRLSIQLNTRHHQSFPVLHALEGHVFLKHLFACYRRSLQRKFL